MLAELPTLDQLPRQTATQVKNKWREVVREVREGGSVAVTNHAEVEMVLIDAGRYEALAASAAALRAREASVLEQLAQGFDERLALLQQPQAGARVDALFAAGGKLQQRPKAGASF